MRVHICAVGRLRAGPEKDLIDDYNKVMKEQHYIRIYKSRGSWEWSSTPELPFVDVEMNE